MKLDDATAAAKADAQGNWRVTLPALKAHGKPHRMTVSGKNMLRAVQNGGGGRPKMVALVR